MISLIDPGPLHLFWTSGVYHFWSLKDKSKIIFIVPKSYQDSNLFVSKIASHESVIHVEYIDLKHLSFLSNFRFSSTIDRILSSFKVDYFLLHNQVYPENQYILNKINQKDVFKKVTFFQIGRMALNWESDFKIRRAVRTEKILNIIPIFSFNIASIVVNFLSSIKFFVIYKVYPFLLLREIFSPAINTYTGQINHRNFVKVNTLVYFKNEELQYKKLGYPNIKRIEHPLVENYKIVFNYLYGEINIDKSVLILPTYGFHSMMLREGWTQDQLLSHISQKWIDSIRILNEKFPGYKKRFKLHPQKNLMWDGLEEKLANEFSDVDFINPKDSAEYWIVRSSVIVGDVSSALWWAALLPDKIVASLDIFEYAAGDEMKSYDNILYLQNVDDLKRI